jgi:hypothetical protein
MFTSTGRVVLPIAPPPPAETIQWLVNQDLLCDTDLITFTALVPTGNFLDRVAGMPTPHAKPSSEQLLISCA